MSILLNEQKYISLRTFRKTGVSVDTAVWFASDNVSTHYVFSAESAGKVKRLRNSPRAQIAACDYKGRLIGEWLNCYAWLIDDPEELGRAHNQFINKYGWIMRITDIFSWLSGRLNKRVYIRIEL